MATRSTVPSSWAIAVVQPLVAVMVPLSFLLACRVAADAIVTGSVFCDQCRDGERSFFDYPLDGVKVAVGCMSPTGQLAAYQEATSTWLGAYGLRFQGGNGGDMTRCYAQVVQAPPECGSGTGPVQAVRPLFGMFGMEMYVVDPLLSMPDQPAGFCPQTGTGNGGPAQPPQIPRFLNPPAPVPRAATAPLLPPPPRAPVGSAPPAPKATACPHSKWMLPEFLCHWRVLTPDTSVTLAFGPVAAARYGTDLTLAEALQGRGDPYKALLREATAALLNSYASPTFYFPTLDVVCRTNWALLTDSPQDALAAALRFRRANEGEPSYGGGACDLAPCTTL